MGAPLSVDLRRRVIEAVEAGASRRAAARRFQVSESAAVKWVAAWRTSGRNEPLVMGAPKGSKLEAHSAFLLEAIAAEPDLTLAELQDKLAARNVRSGLTAIWAFFDRRGISFKKNRARRRADPPGHR
jgi:putative transposase